MKKYAVAAAPLLFPALALAQGQALMNLVGLLGQIINTLVPIVLTAALLFFFYGLARFILAAGDEDAKDRGKRIMIWGVLALFVMASVWGLIGFLGNLFGIGQGGVITTPRIQ